MGNFWTKIFQCRLYKHVNIDNNNSTTGNQNLHKLVTGNVHLITTMQKWDAKLSEASKDGNIVVINFSASWCNSSRTIAQAYSGLSEKHPSIIFLTVDVDEPAMQELSSSWEITATPTFFFLKDGRKVDKLVGANKAELQKKTASVVSLT